MIPVPSRRWILLVGGWPFAMLAAIIGGIVWWSTLPTQADQYLAGVTIQGYERVARDEIPNSGSGDYPPTAVAYYVGPHVAGDISPRVKAKGATVKPIDTPTPGTASTPSSAPSGAPANNSAGLASADWSEDCGLTISLLSPANPSEARKLIRSWNLTPNQRKDIATGSLAIVEAEALCDV